MPNRLIHGRSDRNRIPNIVARPNPLCFGVRDFCHGVSGAADRTDLCEG